MAKSRFKRAAEISCKKKKKESKKNAFLFIVDFDIPLLFNNQSNSKRI